MWTARQRYKEVVWHLRETVSPPNSCDLRIGAPPSNAGVSLSSVERRFSSPVVPAETRNAFSSVGVFLFTKCSRSLF